MLSVTLVNLAGSVTSADVAGEPVYAAETLSLTVTIHLNVEPASVEAVAYVALVAPEIAVPPLYH